MERILVTGASGFIGGEVYRQLVGTGHGVCGLDQLNPIGLPADASWIHMDLADQQARAQLDLLPRVDAVVHCAAVIPKSFTDHTAGWSKDVNIQIDKRIVEFCKTRNLRLVYCSSSSVYGAISGELVDENHRLDSGLSPYTEGKIQAEGLICDNLMSFAILRICAPYGPAQKARTVLRIFIESALTGSTLSYHGSGSREQDFTHVKDVSSALEQALLHSSVNGIFNIAGGAPISMKDLAHLVVRVVGNPNAKVRASANPDSQENYRARFSIERARRLLDWMPAVKLEQGIREWAAQLARERA